MRIIALVVLVALASPTPVLAQAAKPKSSGVPGFGTNSKEPIRIDADRLEVFNKEQRAVYTGNVVAVQGETTIKSATMIVFYDRQNDKTATPAAAGTQAAAASSSEGTSLRRVEAKGGVTVVSKDQVATGNEGVFDRGSNKIILTGNVALSQGQNITKGEKLVYDTETGVAVVESGGTGRVKGFFVPGEDQKDQKGDGKPAAGAKPKDAKPKS